ncbi:MAG: haloacid dehalogenase type II [Acidobacteriota bacterium]|nr:haloacid dehalogenase type II [Acidobacteriota bacterium]MDH3522054.1 haloacid dehalogenase type II [Acidobacteriota bacterium]
MLDLGAFEVLTFDCYGTLVDWEEGIAAAVGGLLARRGIAAGRDEVLALHARFEPALQAGPFRTYREILGGVVGRFGEHYGFEPTGPERAALAESLGQWPVFPDTVAALARLAGRYRLAILSNVDDDLFAATAPRLEVSFDAVVTAQQVGSYKPAPAHFHEALRRLGVSREGMLHVAQSLFHDVAPARALGIRAVWVDRRRGRAGGGATPPSAARPDLEVPDLAALADLAGRAGAAPAGS